MAVRRRDTVLSAIELFRRAVPQVTVTDLLVFLYVAENPGVNVAELASIVGTTMATASRVARSLATEESEGALPPYAGLFEIGVNPNYSRGRLLHLSPRGRVLADSIDQLIGAAHPISTGSRAALADRSVA